MNTTPRTPGFGSDELLRHLVGRFFAGETTPADERRIYDYYRTHSLLPPDLEQYRAMFGWYDNAGIGNNAAPAAPPRQRRRGRTVLLVAAAVAAMLTIGGLGGWMAVKMGVADRADHIGGSVTVSKRAATDTMVIYMPVDSLEMAAE